MNDILIPLFKSFVTGSDRSDSDCLDSKSAFHHSPASAQFPLSSVSSFLSLYENYYFLFLWNEALLQPFNHFQSNVKLNLTALFLVPASRVEIKSTHCFTKFYISFF